MNIMQRVDKLKKMAAARGDYKTVAEESGVTVYWLQKFAAGAIKNPTVNNVSRLERYFFGGRKQDAA